MLPKQLAVLPIISVLLILTLPGTGQAARTDVVEFANGDRITGEVKTLNRGILNFKTDHAGTIKIEWDHIAFLASDQNIQLMTAAGHRYFGHLVRADSQFNVTIQTAAGAKTIETPQVVNMAPIEKKGIGALDVDMSLGYSFTKASEVEQLNFAFDASYRTTKRYMSASGSTIITDSKDNDSSQRQNLNFQYTRIRDNLWLNSGSLNFDRNDELGLDLRTSIGATFGRILKLSNHSSVILQSGLLVSRENVSGEEEDQDSLEATIDFDWDWYRYDSPELDWSTSLSLIPSITEWGRLRGEWDMALKWEIVEDLFLGFDIYNTYDSDPPAEDAEKHDYGITSSVTYKF